jgi:hypothetical protein
MVPLSKLNKLCSKRYVAKAIPAQIACRLLGNEKLPCQLDNLCKACEKSGVWLFYAAFIAVFSAIFFIIFWLLRLTRISKILNLLSKIIVPPFKWLSYCFAGIYNFYKNLPF